MVEKRVYQVWKGSNKFLFSGRLIFGPDVKSMFVTVSLIIMPVVIFCVFVARRLLHIFPNHDSGIAVMVITLALTVHVLLILILTSSRDPGILPRNAHPPEPEDFDSSASPADWFGGHTPRGRLPRTKDVLVNGVPVKVKYCDTCMLYRPPRCSHCSICNNCVERFDHHCPWVGQCIGQRNYRFFFIFVGSATALCIFVFAMSALYIKFEMDGDEHTKPRNVWQAIAKTPASMVLIIYSFIAFWFVGGLTFFHLYLIGTNQTTYENFRYRYEARENPYNLGCAKNFGAILCSPIEKSKNNFRAKVQLDASSQNVAQSQPDAQRGGNVEADNRSPEAGEVEMNEEEEMTGEMNYLSREVKDSIEGALAHATARAPQAELPAFKSELHQSASSWGRQSGNWEITPEVLALAIGKSEDRVQDDSTAAEPRASEGPSHKG